MLVLQNSFMLQTAFVGFVPVFLLVLRTGMTKLDELDVMFAALIISFVKYLVMEYVP